MKKANATNNSALDVEAARTALDVAESKLSGCAPADVPACRDAVDIARRGLEQAEAAARAGETEQKRVELAGLVRNLDATATSGKLAQLARSRAELVAENQRRADEFHVAIAILDGQGSEHVADHNDRRARAVSLARELGTAAPTVPAIHDKMPRAVSLAVAALYRAANGAEVNFDAALEAACVEFNSAPYGGGNLTPERKAWSARAQLEAIAAGTFLDAKAKRTAADDACKQKNAAARRAADARASIGVARRGEGGAQSATRVARDHVAAGNITAEDAKRMLAEVETEMPGGRAASAV